MIGDRCYSKPVNGRGFSLKWFCCCFYSAGAVLKRMLKESVISR